MKKTFFFPLMATLLAFFIAASVHAQDTSIVKNERLKYWLGLQVGGGRYVDWAGLTLGADLNFLHKKNIFTVTVQLHGELREWMDNVEPTEQFALYGVEYGRMLWQNEQTKFLVSAGVGWINTVERGGYSGSSGWLFTQEHYETVYGKYISIPFRVSLYSAGSRAPVGVGISAYANYNPFNSGGGFTMMLLFGRMIDK